MKKVFLNFASVLLILCAGAAFFVSCSNDDNTKSGDMTELNALLSSCDSLLTSATTSDYPQEAITAFQTTVTNAKEAAKSKLTQEEIDNLVVQLTEAKELFLTQAYSYIDESTALIAGWHFDEGTGTTATDYSSSKFVATFQQGASVIFGDTAGTPTWTTGVIGNALRFKNGAYLTVPFNQTFVPSAGSLSVSVWIKPDELYENNYIMSMYYWNGYKLQTQGAGKPFFTYKKQNGDIIDADNELDNSIKANNWNHIVISLDGTNKLLKFYINGTLTKTWTESTKGIGPLTSSLSKELPFVIGAVTTNEEAEAEFNWAGALTPTGHGYFKGTIDELKLYKVALTDGQVTRLYNDEKPSK